MYSLDNRDRYSMFHDHINQRTQVISKKRKLHFFLSIMILLLGRPSSVTALTNPILFSVNRASRTVGRNMIKRSTLGLSGRPLGNVALPLAQLLLPRREQIRLGSVSYLPPRGWVGLQARKSSSSVSQTRPFRLVIVESPSKIETIEKILQKHVEENNLPYDFVVESCKGHIRNLPSKKGRAAKRKKKKGASYENEQETTTAALSVSSNSTKSFPYTVHGINLENNYEPVYEIIPEKADVVRTLCQLASQADRVLLATDPDREGEAMAWHLQQVLSEHLQSSKRASKSKSKNEEEDKFYRRVSFTEITPSAVLEAVANDNMQINPSLVQAQETRRVLDRLFGFTVCPILWSKISPGLSAGRVQSVALALAVQRERERLLFEPTPYAGLEVLLLAEKSSVDMGQEIEEAKVAANLYSVNHTAVALAGDDFTSRGQQLKEKSKHKKHMLIEEAEKLAEFLNHTDTEWTVSQVKQTRRERTRPDPYRTSTLQQDASRKLGMSVSNSMRTAQQLYEQGLISYMRTDSSTLSDDAESAVHSTVSELYGDSQYLRESTKAKKKNSKKKEKDAKFAQEAHEAIRPAFQSDSNTFAPPTDPRVMALPESCQKLYRMIYQRTLASRMVSLVTNLTQVQIESEREDVAATFRASGSVVIHPGYTQAFGDVNEDDEDQFSRKLPALKEGQNLDLSEILAMDHETKPPPRYNEASFVKELESLGVGRPSTFAHIVQTLRDRAYVGNPPKAEQTPRTQRKTLEGSRISAHRAAGGDSFSGGGVGGPLVPSLPAFVVTKLLEEHCPSYIDPGFTSTMEERLDQIASNEMSSEADRILYLDEFYAGGDGLAAKVKHIDDTVDRSVASRASLPALDEESDSDDTLALYVGPYGPFLQRLGDKNGSEKAPSAALPAGMVGDLTSITPKTLRAVWENKQKGGELLGSHPNDNRPIRLKTGRYGAYLQWGDDGEEGTTSHSIPRHKAVAPIVTEDAMEESNEMGTNEPGSSIGGLPLTFEEALGYISLPRVVTHIENEPVLAGLGPYGPYLKFNNSYVSLHKNDGDVLTVDGETAVRVIAEKGNKKGKFGQLADLGEKDGANVLIKTGRYGPYINWNKINAPLPSDQDPDSISLEQAWELLEPKILAGPKSKRSSSKQKQKEDLESILPKPKRPLSAYFHFCAAKREEVAKKEKTLGAVSKELGRMWSETDENGRAEFVEKASLNKAEYEEKLAVWKDEIAALKKSKSAPKKESERKSKASKPKAKKLRVKNVSSTSTVKRPRSAYLFFCKAMRPEVSKSFSSLGEITKEMARLWSELEDRGEYDALAEADKERYQKEKEMVAA